MKKLCDIFQGLGEVKLMTPMSKAPLGYIPVKEHAWQSQINP